MLSQLSPKIKRTFNKSTNYFKSSIDDNMKQLQETSKLAKILDYKTIPLLLTYIKTFIKKDKNERKIEKLKEFAKELNESFYNFIEISDYIDEYDKFIDLSKIQLSYLTYEQYITDKDKNNQDFVLYKCVENKNEIILNINKRTDNINYKYYVLSTPDTREDVNKTINFNDRNKLNYKDLIIKIKIIINKSSEYFIYLDIYELINKILDKKVRLYNSVKQHNYITNYLLQDKNDLNSLKKIINSILLSKLILDMKNYINDSINIEQPEPPESQSQPPPEQQGISRITNIINKINYLRTNKLEPIKDISIEDIHQNDYTEIKISEITYTTDDKKIFNHTYTNIEYEDSNDSYSEISRYKNPEMVNIEYTYDYDFNDSNNIIITYTRKKTDTKIILTQTIINIKINKISSDDDILTKSLIIYFNGNKKIKINNFLKFINYLLVNKKINIDLADKCILWYIKYVYEIYENSNIDLNFQLDFIYEDTEDYLKHYFKKSLTELLFNYLKLDKRGFGIKLGGGKNKKIKSYQLYVIDNNYYINYNRKRLYLTKRNTYKKDNSLYLKLNRNQEIKIKI